MATIAQNKARLAELDGKIGVMRAAHKEAGHENFDILKVEGIFDAGADAADAQERRYEEVRAWRDEAKSIRNTLDDQENARLLDVLEDGKAEAGEAAASGQRAEKGGQADEGKEGQYMRGADMLRHFARMPEAEAFHTRPGIGLDTGFVGEEYMSWLPASRDPFKRALATWTIANALPTEVVPAVRNMVDFIGMLPRTTLMSGNAWRYYRQNTRSNQAAETNLDGATALPESTFTWDETNAPVRSIGHYWPVLQEQLDDVGMLEAELENEGQFGVIERLMTQILTGDGTAPRLRGINNVAGIRTQAKQANESIYAILEEVMGEIETHGRLNTDFIVMHPADYWRMRAEEHSGTYPAGLPTIRGSNMVEGIDIVRTTAQTAGTATLGSYRYLRLIERMGVRMEMTDSHGTDFINVRLVMRAWGRYGLAVMRPSSLGTVTALAA